MINKKLQLAILTIIALCIFLCSCTILEENYRDNEQNENIEEVIIKNIELCEKAAQMLLIADNTTPLDELITETASPQFFAKLRSINTITSRRMTICEINEDIKIECLRVVKGYCYSIHRVSDTGYCICFYKYSESIKDYFVENVFYLNKKYNVLNMLRNMVVNKSTFEEVKEIDPSINIFETDKQLIGDTMTLEGYDIKISSLIKDTKDFDKCLVTEIEVIQPDDKLSCSYTDMLLPVDQILYNIDSPL